MANDIGKDAPCHLASGKCKLKPQRAITSHPSEWPWSIHQQAQGLVSMWGNGGPRTRRTGSQVGAAGVENSPEGPRDVEERRTRGPGTPLLGSYPEKRRA